MLQQPVNAFPVSWTRQGCPANADDVAEAYWMGRLAEGQELLFRAHSKTCPECAAASAEARRFVAAMANVTARLRPSTPAANRRQRPPLAVASAHA